MCEVDGDEREENSTLGPIGFLFSKRNGYAN